MTSDAQRWKQLDAASYDDLADQYDAHSSRLALPVAVRLVEMLRLAAGERVLDVGTGAGMIPLEILRRAPPTCMVVGADISTGMIERARSNATRAGIPESRLSFRQMDAESLSLADAEFDAVVSAFALAHIPHPDLALAEMFRVLRPGGRLLVTVGSRPPLASLSAAGHAARELRRRLQSLRGLRQSSDLLDRVVDDQLPPATDEPHGDSLATDLSRAGAVVTLARNAGFTDVSWTWRNYQNEIAAADEFWDIQRTICTRARKRLLTAPPESIEGVRREFVRRCDAALARGGQLVFPVSAIFVTARRPAA